MIRNLIFVITLAVTLCSTIYGLAIKRPTGVPLELELGLKLEREGTQGSYALLRPDSPSQAGDRLQLLFKTNRRAFVMVASKSGTQTDILYPALGQTGNVRGTWTYAMPSPNQSYTLDGKATRLIVVVSKDALPKRLEQRLATVKAAQKNSSPLQDSARHPVTLRDGSPATLQMQRASAANFLVAVVDLEPSPKR